MSESSGVARAGRAIDYFFTLQSPWSYLGHRAFIEVARRHGSVVRYRPLALLPVFRESGGLPLARRHPVRQRYRMIELQRWRDRRGLSFNLQPRFWPFDAGLADRVVAVIASRGEDVERFLPSAFAGVWESEFDLANADVLARLLRECDFDDAAVLHAAESAAASAAYSANAADALAAGVFGAPAYVLAGEVFWGQDRVDLLDDALTSGRLPYSD